MRPAWVQAGYGGVVPAGLEDLAGYLAGQTTPSTWVVSEMVMEQKKAELNVNLDFKASGEVMADSLRTMNRAIILRWVEVAGAVDTSELQPFEGMFTPEFLRMIRDEAELAQAE